MSAENSGKPLDGQGSNPNPAGEAHNTPQTSLPAGEAVAAPPQEPDPALGLRPFGLPPPMKNLGHALEFLVLNL